MSFLSRLRDAREAFFASQTPEAITDSDPMANPIEYFVWSPEDWVVESPDEIVQKHGLAPYRRMQQTDAQISSCLGTLILARLSTDFSWTARGDDPVDVQAAELMTETFDCIDGGALQPFEDCLDGLGMGFYCGEKLYGDPYPFTFSDGHTKQIWTIRRINPIPQETIMPKRNRSGDIEEIWQSRQRTLVIPSLDPASFEKFPAQRFAVWSWRRQWDNPLGISILRPAYAPHLGKIKVRKDWLRYMERFNLPMMGLQVPSSTSEPKKTALVAKLRKMSSRQTYALPSNYKLDIRELSHTATSSYQDATTAFNKEIARACFMPSLIMDGGESTGSNALGSSHRDNFAWTVDSIGRALENRFARPIAAEVTALNFGDRVRPPRGRFEDFSQKDVVRLLTIVKGAVDLGMEIDLPWTHEVLGVKRAEEGGEILKKADPPQLDPENFPEAPDPDQVEEETEDVAAAALARDLRNAKGTGDVDAILAVLSGEGKESKPFAQNGWDK